MFSHVLNTIVMHVSMSGQNPFELVIQQLFHRTNLFRPRIPRNTSKCCQCSPHWRPRKMISSKQEFVLIQENHVSARVTRSRNGNYFITEIDITFPVQHSFNSEPNSTIVAMHYPRRAETFTE